MSRRGIRSRAFVHAFRLGWREAWSQQGALVGVFLTYSVILAMWANLYRLLDAATLSRVSLSYAQLVWYLALTELVPFSIGHTYRRVEEEIRDGTVAAQLVRPVGYAALVSAQELGHMLAKIAALASPAAALGYALTGTVPFGIATVPALAVSLAAGSAVLLALQVLIGLSSAWLGSARPLFFIVQKLVFVLGGLVMPLQAYPSVIAHSAWFTPFPAMLYAPGSLALDPSGTHVAATFALQASWLGAAWLGVAATAAAFERRLVRLGAPS